MGGCEGVEVGMCIGGLGGRGEGGGMETHVYPAGGLKLNVSLKKLSNIRSNFP